MEAALFCHMLSLSLFLVLSHYVSDFKEIKSIIFFLQPHVMVLQVLTGLFPLLQ